MHVVSHACRALVAGAALLVVLCTAHASTFAVAGKPATARAAAAASSAASRPAARTPATREQLRDCLADEDALHARQRKLEEAHAAHERAITDLQEESAKIVEVQGQLDHGSQTAVNAFNLLVTQHNVRTDEVNKEASELTAQGQAFNVDSLATSRRCSLLAYRLEDMEAVMKERTSAAR